MKRPARRPPDPAEETGAKRFTRLVANLRWLRAQDRVAYSALCRIVAVAVRNTEAA